MFTKIIYTFFFLVAISFNAQSKTGIQFQTKNLEEAKKLNTVKLKKKETILEKKEEIKYQLDLLMDYFESLLMG